MTTIRLASRERVIKVVQRYDVCAPNVVGDCHELDDQGDTSMTTSSRFVTSAFAAVAGSMLTATGCGHSEAKPASTPTTSSAVAPAALAPASPGKANSTIYLSDRLKAACGISTIASIQEAPKFDFDQEAILPEDRDVLGLVAQCLTTGPLKGRAVRLVGRADPRGTPEYNMALGERRSNAVLKYLTGLGVASSQLSETSRGSLDAKGNDENAWRTDRRVDLDVLDAAH